MVRALVIRLGEALAPVQARLEREFDARPPDARAAVLLQTHDAPVAAVGNLSRPVQVLREQLEAALTESLNRLLALKPGNGGDFVVDVYVLLNLGEPLVANATMVIIGMLSKIVDEHFRAIFPRHRMGAARRFRIVPIAILPAASDCEKDRSDAIDELESLHDSFVEARKNPDAEREFFVDRVFLLDAMTSRGIAARDELVAQVTAFLRLCIFGGIRRHPDVVRLLESDRSDLFASFAVASCEVDHEVVERVLTLRMKAEVAAELVREQTASLPSPAELLPARVLQDANARERALKELDALPRRILEADGAGAVQPLCARYDELRERIDAWREADVAVVEASDVPARASAGGAGAMSIGLGVGLLLGAAVAAAAHFFALVSVTAVAASGGGVAIFAFLTTWLVLRRRGQDAPAARLAASDAPATDGAERDAALDSLQHAVDQQRTRLNGLREGFDAIARAFGDVDSAQELDGSSTAFHRPLVSAELLAALYDSRVATADMCGVVAGWLAGVGEWGELLAGRARADALGLDQYCSSRFVGVGAGPLFAQVSARECVAPQITEFVGRWNAGLAVFLEGESRIQFDPDGFDFPMANTLFAPEPLHPALQAQLDRHGSMLTLHPVPITTDDVFVITAVTDIHPAAVSPLADRPERHD